MRQPIELVQRESTSQRGARIKAHGLFTASLTAETCLSAKIYQDLGSKSLQVNEGGKEGRKSTGSQPYRCTDPLMYLTQLN